MKRIISVVLILILGGLAFAQVETTSSVVPKDARSMGLGGSFRVFSTGYGTFFGNPAGFASPKGSLTIADLATWAYFKPTQENIDELMTLTEGTATEGQMASTLGNWILDNGLGAGASLGLGWAGKGFGLGATLVSDNVASGTSFLGATVNSRLQATAIAGVGLPLTFGPVNIRLGADARAYYLLDSTDGGWSFSEIVTPIFNETIESPLEVLDSLYVVGGYGFAFDAGATVGIGPFTLGAMVRDYGLEFNRETVMIGDIVTNQMIPTEGTEPYILEPVVSGGMAFQFNIGNFLKPSLYLETDDIGGLFEDGFDTVWTTLHAGAELKVLNFIALRAGMNRGWVSLGAGVDLLIFEVDAALFTEELGLNPGDYGRTGLALQVAFRL